MINPEREPQPIPAESADPGIIQEYTEEIASISVSSDENECDMVTCRIYGGSPTSCDRTCSYGVGWPW